ncbi:MAG: hypothetical protein JWN95_2055 [Frankiales bacterium]|nr:hypothetical protein [Frankiales bacterium]
MLSVRLHTLTFLPEDEGVMVGCTDTNSYALFPPDGVALIQQLANGVSPGAASDWYQRTYGEPVDIDDFVQTLAELDFIDDGDADADPPPVRWQGLGRAVFSPVAWVGYALLIGAAILVCTAQPALLPHQDHAFFSRYLLVIELTVAFGQLPLILIHECFHVLAARRLGLRARIRIGYRLYFVVFETVMDGLVIVPRRRRYLPMLAGMLADLLLACLLTIVAWATRDGGRTTLTSGVCLALALTTLIRLAMEFFLFLRTDVYYLAATLSGCVDLHTTTREIVHNWLWRQLGRPDRMTDPARWHPNDVRAARWYAPLYLLGYAVAITLLATVLLPISWRFLHTSVSAALGHNLSSARFWDAAGLLALNTAQPAFAGLLKVRDLVGGRRADRAAAVRREQARRNHVRSEHAHPPLLPTEVK